MGHMNAAVFQFVVLASALLLALPPGWCCQDWAPRHEVKPAARSCCAARVEHPPEDSPQQPGSRLNECCCDRSATVSGKSVADKDDLRDGALLLALADPAPTQGNLAPHSMLLEEEVFRDAGPPLHILHCVWLC